MPEERGQLDQAGQEGTRARATTIDDRRRSRLLFVNGPSTVSLRNAPTRTSPSRWAPGGRRSTLSAAATARAVRVLLKRVALGSGGGHSGTMRWGSKKCEERVVRKKLGFRVGGSRKEGLGRWMEQCASWVCAVLSEEARRVTVPLRLSRRERARIADGARRRRAELKAPRSLSLRALRHTTTKHDLNLHHVTGDSPISGLDRHPPAGSGRPL